MTEQDKKLLLKDLCARLPYNCRVFYEYVDELDGKTYGYSLTLNTWCIDEFVANKAVIKPYLRPISSMTEEERTEYFLLKHRDNDREDNIILIDEASTLIDWLNVHHFNYRGLIEKGLALEAKEGMYNIKEK